jgi:hypothetical protein
VRRSYQEILLNCVLNYYEKYYYQTSTPERRFPRKIHLTINHICFTVNSREVAMNDTLSRLALTLLLASMSFPNKPSPRATQAALSSATRPLPNSSQNQVPESCPVTKPPTIPFIPPSPYPSQNSPDGFWFGTDALWTQLPTDGTWKGLPHYKPTDTAFRNKIFWWRQGYDGHKYPQPGLKVSGKRLNSTISTPPIATGEYANAGWGNPDQPFIVTGVAIPTLGCWRITGQFKDAELSFVVWITQ